jgi:hypothetical protein
MTERTWQTWPPDLADDQALTAAVLDIHDTILRDRMSADPMVNQKLEVQQRAFRHVDGWRVLLLLTPWMLSRLLFPDEPPALAIPEGWAADDRTDADYLVLGPRLGFELLGQPQKAHLNYHPRVGHYLLQPICLNMQPYADAEAVFAEWSQVIRVRDQNMEKARRDCPLQKEVSRRELLLRIRPSQSREDER